MAEDQWNKVVLYTTTEGIEIVTAFLSEHGVAGFEIADGKDFENFLESTEIHWDYVEEDLMKLKDAETSITFYLPDNAQGRETYLSIQSDIKALPSLVEDIDLGRLYFESDVVYEKDWATVWKQFYHPTPIGDKLMVIPSWEVDSVDCEGRVPLILDPGMAFGTGTHSSTKLCLMHLQNVVSEGDQMLDIGCGSGILAVSSLLLGAEKAIGVDIDELAAKISLENAELNHVEDRLTTYVGDLTDKVSGTFDVICANIVADVIIRLAPDVLGFLNPGGHFITSGIIDTREQDVLDALDANGIKVDKRLEEKGWVSLLCSRK